MADQPVPVPEQCLPLSYGAQAFGSDPASYDAARPDYPDWVFQILAHRCGLGPGSAVFEIGPGTGKATLPMLDAGARSLCAIEPDPRLAGYLRTRHPGNALQVIGCRFEDAELPEGGFDLGVSATSLHWLDEDTTLSKVARLLRPEGWWAAIWNVYGDRERPDAFHLATVDLLRSSESPSQGKHGLPFALDDGARRAAFIRAGAFDRVDREMTEWSLSLDADQVVSLYATYSNVNARPDRREVLVELGRIAREDFGGRVIRNMTTVLYTARRRP